MTEQKDHTFTLDPGSKTRYSAGQYDYETNQPRYEIKISAPSHVRNQIEVKEILIGTPKNCNWLWEIHNKSSWLVFVIIKKDGIKI